MAEKFAVACVFSKLSTTKQSMKRKFEGQMWKRHIRVLVYYYVKMTDILQKE